MSPTRLRIRDGGLDSPVVVAFLEAHLTELRSITPPESTHALDLDGLAAPGVAFWSAYDGDELVACAALKTLDAHEAELKSMRTAPHRTGEGIAATVLAHVLDRARSAGFGRVSLETGSEDFFAPARRLYARHGFVECPPFGDYRPDPLSTFMTRLL